MARATALMFGLLVAALLTTPAAASAKLRFFQSPSGNIACLVHDGGARCDITRHSWRAPRKPRSCELDWGTALSVARNRTRGHFSCVGDTVRDPRARRLAYGRSISVGGVRCASRVDGVRCANGHGRGFFVSRQRYKLF